MAMPASKTKPTRTSGRLSKRAYAIRDYGWGPIISTAGTNRQRNFQPADNGGCDGDANEQSRHVDHFAQLNQPPTIQIRPGYVFNVMINKDMILPPWQSGAVASEEDE